MSKHPQSGETQLSTYDDNEIVNHSANPVANTSPQYRLQARQKTTTKWSPAVHRVVTA